MSYQEVLGQQAIAISTSESPDMAALGLSDEHLRDAMAEIARHLLALGARLMYGGDLRQHGFSELLFELVARHRRDADEGDDRTAIVNYLAWPVHIVMSTADVETFAADLAGIAELVCLGLDGTHLSKHERRQLPTRTPTDAQWSHGLTSMRQTMRAETDARIVLGGRVDEYKGIMPGIAEEALLSLKAKQPLYLMGGFGGCARDVAETMGLVSPWAASQSAWPNRATFNAFSVIDLNNGLTPEENATLARTPHVDQAVTLILRGLLNVASGGSNLPNLGTR
jgi:SLOG cluster2